MLIAAVLAVQITISSDKPPRRIEVTPEHLATAFHDERARDLFNRARKARTEQDVSLRNYEATVRERQVIGVAIGDNGRERGLFGTESASRVRWQRGVGAYVDITGARLGIPMAPRDVERSELLSTVVTGGFTTIPYFPGQESMWLGGAVGNNQVNDRQVVNPLAEGAEAYYTYEVGDSVSYAFSDGSEVQLRELKVRPRTPAWNVAVGSLQFDIASGQLVAAMYRMSAPQDVFESLYDNLADTAKNERRAIGFVKAFAPRVQSQFSEVLVEYAMHEGRYWLPRSRTFRGTIDVGSITMPATVQQAFTYLTVNGADTLPPIDISDTASVFDSTPDSLSEADKRKWRDSVSTVWSGRRSAAIDSVRNGNCGPTGTRTIRQYRRLAQLAISVTTPCDIDKLASSPDLSKLLFAADDTTFKQENLEELAKRALGLRAQAAFSLLKPPRPNWRYGLSMSRYNRVEGFSTGVQFVQPFGGGYTASALGRYGVADHELTGGLTISRTNQSKTIELGGYRRLVSANDWGNPLSFGASVSGLFFGRDDGFYYRAAGGEVTFRREGATKLDLRFFSERQTTATQETEFSIGGNFAPNIVAGRVRSTGASLQLHRNYGHDPLGLRAFTALRLEGAGGDSTYGRGAVDLTMSRGLFGNVAAALTLAAGSTVGGVPAQRQWYLGGVQTVRGQRPDTAQRGNAFWLARAELGVDARYVRTSVFGDVGWVGDRTAYKEVGRPLSGVGLGFSMLDGLVRLDVSRGLYPLEKFRVDLSLNARW